MPIMYTLSDCFMPGFELKPFKPSAWYNKSLDWLMYLTRDCSYVAHRTERPYLESLMDGEDVVGFKVLFFSELPRPLRDAYLEATGLDPDDIAGIEDILILNAVEAAPEIDAAQTAFIEEFRRGIALGLIKS